MNLIVREALWYYQHSGGNFEHTCFHPRAEIYWPAIVGRDNLSFSSLAVLCMVHTMCISTVQNTERKSIEYSGLKPKSRLNQ